MWAYSPQYIDFQLRKYTSENSLLIRLESSGITWSQASITILLNDQTYRDNLYFG